MKQKYKQRGSPKKTASLAPKPISRQFLLFSAGLIVLLGIIIYSNTFQVPFELDDRSSIINNAAIRDLANFPKILGFLPRRCILYLTLAFNYHFNHLDVVGYHLVNLCIHLMAALSVWWLLLLTFSTPAMKEEKIAHHAGLIALLAGLVFVAHPVQTEAVTYIVQRDAALATLFYVATLNLYIKSRLSNRPFYYIGAFGLAVLAMFTKETAITLPLIMLLYEFCFFKERNWARSLPFLVTILVIPLTMLCTETSATRMAQLKTAPGISSMHYLLTQFRVIVTYLRLIFIPIHQNLDYDYPILTSLFQVPVWTSVLLLIAILWWGKLLFVRYRLISFSIFWFFITLLPESSVLPIRDVIFEHRLYLPLVGYSLFLVSSGYYLLGKNGVRPMIIVLGIIISGYALVTFQRNEVWQSEVALLTDTINKSPHKARPYNNLAEYYRIHNDLAQALFYYNKTIALGANGKTFSNRGAIYMHQGNLDQAIQDDNQAIRLNPVLAIAYRNRGLAYSKKGSYNQAIADYTKAIELNSDSHAYFLRGLAYGTIGHFNQAAADFSKTIELDPADAQNYNNRGFAYYKEGRYNQAIADLDKALELEPDLKQAYLNRLQALKALGK